MKWKEVYNKCNNKKFSAITEIKEPASLKSTFGIFLDKYKLALLIGVIVLSVGSLFIYKLNMKAFLSVLAVFAMIGVALVYYNSYKVELKNGKLNLNIMFRNIQIKQDDLATIFISKQTSNLFLVVPFNVYSINIIFSDNGIIRGYSLSTIMVKKTDVIKFFKHFEFRTLEQQKDEEKKDDIFNGIRRIFSIFIGILIIFIIVFYLFH